MKFLIYIGADIILNFFNDLEKNNKFDKGLLGGIQDFIEDLANSLKTSSTNRDEDIVTQIISNNKVTLATENSIFKARENAIHNYASQTENDGPLYYIYNKVKNSDDYRVIEISDGAEKTLTVNKSKLPNEATVDSCMRKSGNDFILDDKATQTIANTIKNDAKALIEKQNQELADYKKEKHIYLVTEDTSNRIFLYDTTSKPEFEIEEIDFPKELRSVATEGKKFIFTNGSYELYE